MKINDFILSELELKVRTEEYRNAIAYEEESDLQSLLIFSLANEWCAFSVTDLQEVLPIQEIIHIPYMPPTVLGVTNLRGNQLLTFDLQILLNLSRSNESENIIVVRSSEHLTGLLVNKVKGVNLMRQGNFQVKINISSGVPTAYIQGVKIHEESALLWLNMKKIIEKLEEGLS